MKTNWSQSASTDIEQSLNPQTGMDAVTLRVGDLELMSSYYQNALALTPIEEASTGRITNRILGRGDQPMLRLAHTPDLPAGNRNDAGLYHTAFLFETPASLSATVYRAAQDPRSQFVGSADHLVSEAFYFTDPEGNGIELYTDRDRSEWKYSGNELKMATLPLDPNRYLSEHLTEEAVQASAALPGKVGHVHLQVGDIETARKFYVDILGFDVTTDSYPGALFASAGGYHHHLGMNTWHSAGAGPRAASLGLGELAITVPERADLDSVAARLLNNGLAFADDGRSITVKDPWGTEVRLSLPGIRVADLLTR